MNTKVSLPICYLLLISFLGLFSCSKDEGTADQMSYDLGTVAGFCELVAADVKQLALSPVIDPAEMDEFYGKVLPIAEKYGVSIYRESDLIITDLFPSDVAQGKEVLLIYKDKTLDAYMDLKEALTKLSPKDMAERRALSRRFGRLLSYSPQKINQLLAANTDFRTLSDFGIRANNLFLYWSQSLVKTMHF